MIIIARVESTVLVSEDGDVLLARVASRELTM